MLMLYLLGRPSTRAVVKFSTAACSLNILERIGVAEFEEAKRVAVEEKWPHSLPVDAFLTQSGVLGGDVAPDAGSRTPVLIDVRAPCEYAKGHIPGAISVPLFTDEERAAVGTLYKQQGHDIAVRKGLKFVDAKGPEGLLGTLPAIEALPDDVDLYVYCFRGGMRSGGMAWMLSQALPGRVHTLNGGYKRFRNWAIDRWQEPRPVVVLGGRTGSGKTDVLLALRDELGAQVIDLEGDAHHRGSIFGSLGRPPQPTNEHYENKLAVQWARFSPSAPVFIEDESKAVGSCGVPPGLWAMMRGEHGRSLRLDVPHEARVEKLVAEYGVYPPADLAACVRGLKKRLGGEKSDALAAALEQDPPALAEVADALLVHYYDDMYVHQMKKKGGHDDIVETATGDALTNARLILKRAADFDWDDATPTGA